MKNKQIVKVLIIAGAVIISSFVLGYFYLQSKKPQQIISVIGLEEKDFESDLIVWNSEYSIKAENLKDAYTMLRAQTEVVKSYLTEKGISPKEITFSAIDNQEDFTSYYEGEKYLRKFNGYVLTQKVKVSSREVNKIEQIANNVTELIYQGINFKSWQPEYYYTKLADLKIEMLAGATKDAKMRAETIAKNAGSKLGKLKTSNVGTFQITAPNSSEDEYSWGGAFNTSSKLKRAAVTMRVVYNVQ